jgi:hypothetical protein
MHSYTKIMPPLCRETLATRDDRCQTLTTIHARRGCIRFRPRPVTLTGLKVTF